MARAVDEPSPVLKRRHFWQHLAWFLLGFFRKSEVSADGIWNVSGISCRFFDTRIARFEMVHQADKPSEQSDCLIVGGHLSALVRAGYLEFLEQGFPFFGQL